MSGLCETTCLHNDFNGDTGDVYFPPPNHQVHVPCTLSAADGAMKLIGKAMSARHVAATRMNRESSRSHCIITLGVEQRGPPVLGDSLSRRNPARSSLLSLGRGVGLQEVRRSKL